MCMKDKDPIDIFTHSEWHSLRSKWISSAKALQVCWENSVRIPILPIPGKEKSTKIRTKKTFLPTKGCRNIKEQNYSRKQEKSTKIPKQN